MVFADFKYVAFVFRCIPRSCSVCRLIHSRFQGLTWALAPPASVCQSRIRLIRSQSPTLPWFFNEVPVFLSLPVFGFAALTIPVPEARSSLTGIVSSTSGSRARWENLATILRPGTGKLAFVIPETRDRICPSTKSSQPGLRAALLDTDPATAFNPFLGFLARNSKAARSAVYVTLHNSGEFDLPLGYATINGDLFKLPAGPVSFAIGGEYRRGENGRAIATHSITRSNRLAQSIGKRFRVNRDVWSIYEEVRVPFTSPTWNFPGFYSFEVDFAEREEWYSQNTSTVLTPFQPATSSRYNSQKPKVSVRWQPLDPKYIGALTSAWQLHRSVSCANLIRDDVCLHAELPNGEGSIFKVNPGPDRGTG